MKGIKQKILSVLEGGEILIIVPPFVSIIETALGPHHLQALAEKNGYKVDILYLNMLLASILGVECYENIFSAPEFWMLGDRFFARSAYGLPPLGKHPEWCADESLAIGGSKGHPKMFYNIEHHFDLDTYLQMEKVCHVFIDKAAAVIASIGYNIIGSTMMLGQINAGVALLTRVKQHCPDAITIAGGCSCTGEMAEGIASLSEDIDYIFSGESESTFLNFLKNYSTDKVPPHRIILGEPVYDLDSIPLPDYETFFKQYASFLGKASHKKRKIWYEISRGCWWAQKSKCTFCSVTHLPSYRRKSVNKVVHDLKRISELFPDRMLFISDNIMPRYYHKELLPIIGKNKKEFPPLAYQLKADFDLKDLVRLKAVNIDAVFPGIESFSNHLLKLMKKGITAAKNILFLRNAMSIGIYCDWLLLFGFPGDKISDYEEILRIIRLIRHFPPPRKIYALWLMRFSPYFENHQSYKITNVCPWAVYRTIYPARADIEKLAFFYIGDYPCESNKKPEIIREIFDEIACWKKTWEKAKLVMVPYHNNYLVYDTRNPGKGKTHILDPYRAREIMNYGVYNESEYQKWAVEKKLGVVVGSQYVPLVTASPGLLLEFEREN